MRIYLSTAITGGRREYVETVRKIAEALEVQGAEVLNRRVADPTFPSREADPRETMLEVDRWLQEADALVGEATISSTGVGCELTTVLTRGKPVLLLYDAHFGFRISDWVTHHPDKNVESRPYRDGNEIREIIREFVGRVKG